MGTLPCDSDSQSSEALLPTGGSSSGTGAEVDVDEVQRKSDSLGSMSRSYEIAQDRNRVLEFECEQRKKHATEIREFERQQSETWKDYYAGEVAKISKLDLQIKRLQEKNCDLEAEIEQMRKRRRHCPSFFAGHSRAPD